MKRYWITYVTVSGNGVWVKKNDKFIKAENFNQIILELAKTVTGKFYLLEIREEIVDNEYGGYRLVFPSEAGEIKPLDRHLDSYIKEIEKTIGHEKTIFLDELYARKLRKILNEIVDRFCGGAV